MLAALLPILSEPVICRAAVTLKTTDALGSTSFTGATNWSDGLAPHPSADYLVAVSYLRTPPDGNNYTFAGKSLTITNGGGMIYKGTATANTYTINPLVLNNGGVVRSGAGSGNTMILAGAISVVGTNGSSQILADQSPYTINSAFSGTGSLLFSGGFTTTVNSTNSFAGNTSVSGLLTLNAGSTWTFKIGGGGTNNSISGAGAATFNGRFTFDLSGASTNLGDSWAIATTTTKTFGGGFSVDGFARQGFGVGPGVWDLNTNGVYYEFNTSSGVLSVLAAPGGAGSGSLSPSSTKFDGLEVDVALSYSPDAASREGGEDNIQLNLANAIVGANADHKRSGSGVRLRIAGFYMSVTNPVSVDNTAISIGVGSDPGFQDVRDFGASVGADLVSYYSHSTGAAGNAGQPGTYSAIGEQWIYHLVVAHELGHNFGCAHQDGHINPKTIMLHNYCPQGGAQGYFSNPQIWLNGVQLLGDGDASTCINAALISGGDNANRLAGAAQGVADHAARVLVGPNLNNVILRWLFTNAPGLAPAGTTNSDLISGAPAIVRGNGAAYTGNALRIPGGTTGNVAMNSMAAYIDLPNGIVSSQTNITIELWATPLSAPNWARIIDFGRAAQAGDGLGAAGEFTGAINDPAPGTTTASDNILLSAAIGTDITQQRFEAVLGGAATNLDANLSTIAGVPHHYAITFTDGAGAAGTNGGRWQWYRDGDAIAYLDVANHLSVIQDVNNWLGRSQYSSDSLANNDYTEVRVSSVAMSRREVLANFLLGPNYAANTTVLLTNSDASGASSFNTAGQWGSGASPNAANSYETFDFLLRTPATANSYTFGGNTLKVSGGELLYKSTGGSTITVTNLVLNGGTVHHVGAGTLTLAGNIAVTTNGAEFNAQSGSITVNAPISGLAPVYYLGNTVILSGGNSNFLGKTYIGNGVAGTVQIDTESRLGPIPASFISDQLTMNRGTLTTTTSMTLSNSNRGILIDVSGGTFNVASGTTLTLASTLSSTTAANYVAGALGKAGAGTLILSTTNTTFQGALFSDTGSTTANDGVLRIVNNQALANARSPFFIRNNNSGSSTLLLDGSAGNIALSQGISVAGRSASVPAIESFAGTNTISGGITINVGGGNYWIQSDAGQLNIGGTISSAATGSRTITFLGAGKLNVTGVIADGSATVNVAKSGGGTLTLAGANTYSGTTTVTTGTLLVNGSVGAGALTVAGGATLTGNGTINGPVTIQPGAILAPGTSIGTMTLATPPILSGTTLMEINRTNAQNADQLVVSGGTLSYGGALAVTNLGPNLQPGDNFQLFIAPAYAGSFSATNLPVLNTGLAWNFNTANGVLSVISLNPTNITFGVSGGAMSLSWPADHIGWVLQTNGSSLTATGAWFDYPGSGSVTNASIDINQSANNVFFRLRSP